MAEKLTIKERIAMELQARLQAALPAWMDEEIAAGRAVAADKVAATADRVDGTGNEPTLFSVLVIEGPVDQEAGMQGGGGTVRNEQEVVVQVFLPIREQSTDPPMREANRWIGRMVGCVMADPPHLPETGTGELLVTDIHPDGEDAVVAVVAKQQELVASAAFVVVYDTVRGNPYKGPANNERTV